MTIDTALILCLFRRQPVPWTARPSNCNFQGHLTRLQVLWGLELQHVHVPVSWECLALGGLSQWATGNHPNGGKISLVLWKGL